MTVVFKYLLGLVFGVMATIVIFFTAVEGVVFDENFFHHEMQKFDISQTIGIEQNELDKVVDSVLDYLRGHKEGLQVEVKVMGVQRHFFNEQEIIHMEDVKYLFDEAFKIRKRALVILLGTIIIGFIVRPILKYFMKGLAIINGLLIMSFLTLGFLLFQNFNKYFTIFHLIFFDNDLWIFDPETSLMINMLPEAFFYDYAIRSLIYVFIPIVLIFLTSIIIIRRKKLP